MSYAIEHIAHNDCVTSRQAFSLLVRSGVALLDYESWLAAPADAGGVVVEQLIRSWRAGEHGCKAATFPGFCKARYRDYLYQEAAEQLSR